MDLSQSAKNEKSSLDEGLNFQRAASIKLNAKHDAVKMTMSCLYQLCGFLSPSFYVKNIK